MRKSSNVEDIVSIHKYHDDLARKIDDADWMGEYDTTENLRTELKHIKESIDNGEVWYPLF